MGGFVFDTSRNNDSFPFRGRQERIVIDPSLLMWLAKNEPLMIPEISLEYIKDKSKANGLAKLLVCVQAAWFGIQVITRLVQGLAVTLLELNVFAHVICALLSYIFWWNKPLDIDEPTAIYTDDPKAASIYAAFWARGTLGNDTPLVVRRGGLLTTELMSDVRLRVDQVVLSPQRARELRSQCPDGSSVRQGPAYFSNQGYESEDLILRLNIDSKFEFDLEDRILIELNSPRVQVELERLSINLHTGLLGHDSQFYAAFKIYHLQRYLWAYTHPVGLKFLSIVSHNSNFHAMRTRVFNFPGFHLLGEFSSGFLLHIYASGLYGLWHLTAWNGPFRTTAEAMLWNVSALSTGFSFALVAHLAWPTELPIVSWKPRMYIRKRLPPRILNLIHVFRLALGGMMFCLLIFCRTYLVVEPFIGLAFAPDGVYAIPQWSTYFPHIG